jgi:hypothetical protein
LQRYTGRLCARCGTGYYPWFVDCLECPDGFGWSPKNALTVFYRYGIIWLLWVVVNRFLCEKLLMADSYAALRALTRISTRGWGGMIQVAELRSNRGRAGRVLGALARSAPSRARWLIWLVAMLSREVNTRVTIASGERDDTALAWFLRNATRRARSAADRLSFS